MKRDLRHPLILSLLAFFSYPEYTRAESAAILDPGTVQHDQSHSADKIQVETSRLKAPQEQGQGWPGIFTVYATQGCHLRSGCPHLCVLRANAVLRSKRKTKLLFRGRQEAKPELHLFGTLNKRRRVCLHLTFCPCFLRSKLSTLAPSLCAIYTPVAGNREGRHPRQVGTGGRGWVRAPDVHRPVLEKRQSL